MTPTYAALGTVAIFGIAYAIHRMKRAVRLRWRQDVSIMLDILAEGPLRPLAIDDELKARDCALARWRRPALFTLYTMELEGLVKRSVIDATPPELRAKLGGRSLTHWTLTPEGRALKERQDACLCAEIVAGDRPCLMCDARAHFVEQRGAR